MQPESLSQFLAWQGPAVEELIGPGMLHKGAVMFLYGEQETMKSWMLLDLAFSLLEGRNWLLWRTRKSKVLLHNPEIPKPMYQDRVKTFLNARQLNLNGAS